jgi:hypothetical protein
MTLSAGDARDEYTATASQTVFNYTFKIYASTDLNVYVTPAGQECADSDLTTAYTVSGVGAEAGGTITLTTPSTAGDLVTIVSAIPTDRTTDYQNNGDFRPDTVNDDFDRVVSLTKQIEDVANRSLQFPQCLQGASSLSLPRPVAGNLVRWKTDLSGLENVAYPTNFLNVTSQDLNIVDGQLSYTITEGGLTLSGARVEIAKSGSEIDGTLLIAGTDYTVTSDTTFDLLRSYSDGVIRVSNVVEVAQDSSVNRSIKLTTDIISTNQFSDMPTGGVVETYFYSAEGDGGGAEWRKTGVTGLTASQTPAQRGNDTLTDADGNEWKRLGSFKSDIKKLGAQDGATDITAILDSALASDGDTVLPKGVWNGTTATIPEGKGLEANTFSTINFAFTGPMKKGANRYTFSGDYQGTLGHLGHTGTDNKGNSYQNALAVFRGTDTAPSTDNLYARTAQYIELHTNKVHSVAQSVWGNSFKSPAITVESIAHDLFEGEANGGAFRAYSTDVPASATSTKKNLVGVSAIGQTNSGAGNAAWSVWGANFVAAQTSGNAPTNCVGIETDVIHVTDATAATGPSDGNNFTAYWAQADGDSVYSTAAFYTSKSTRSSGWNYGYYAMTPCRDWGIYVNNTEGAGSAGGAYIRSVSTSGNVLQVDWSGNQQFIVGNSTANPISVRVNSTLKQVTEGATDSGGAGFKLLRVPN